MNEKDIKNLLVSRNSLVELQEKFNKYYTCSGNPLYKQFIQGVRDLITKLDEELLEYVNKYATGSWLMLIRGMTVDIAAGILIYFDIKGKECAAQFIKYAGADNNKFQHNSNLRILLNNLMENFKNTPESLYGRINDK